MCLEYLNDDDLAKNVQAGDRLSLNVLVHRHQRRLFGWLLHCVKNQQDVEDILQDVWLRVVNTIHNYRVGDQTFSAWLFYQTWSARSEYYRSRSKRREVSGSE